MEDQPRPQPRRVSHGTSIVHGIGWNLRSMTLGFGSPCPNAIIGSYKVVPCQNSIISVRNAPDHLPPNIRPPVPAPVVRTERVGEGTRGRRQEWRWKRSRRSFREERVSRFEVKWRSWLLVERLIRQRSCCAAGVGCPRRHASSVRCL